ARLRKRQMNENTRSELHERLITLREQHRALDTSILELEAADAVDQLQISRLKRRKLQLKDEIAKLEDALLPDIIA
ncbi:MAG: YdcH family protein, partial [Hyphomicrobiaceae bacterium]